MTQQASDKKHPVTRQADVAIIGAGSGGLYVASGLAQLGLSVVLFERGEMGGDCLNTGCVPSKSMIRAADVAQTMRDAGPYGIAPVTPDIDFAAVKDHVVDVIGQIAPHDSQERFEKLGVHVIRDHAVFTDPRTLCGGGEVVKFRFAVIASGSRPTIPPIPGIKDIDVLTNETIFDLQERPEHLVIIGGGPIGMEMAQAHSRLGVQVTVCESSTILSKDEPELTDKLRKRLLDEGVTILENARVEEIRAVNKHGLVHINQGGEITKLEASHILVAVGRTANAADMGLEEAGVNYTDKGIRTDKRLRTSAKHIYAIGDCAGGPQFTHIAGYHGGIVIRNIVFKIPAKIDYSALPWVTYTDPELAHTGLSEAEARDRLGDSIKILTRDFMENDRARAERRTQGTIKVITDKRGKVLGASILAPHAGDLIAPWILAIISGLKVSALANMIAPYPTLGEASKHVASSFYTESLFNPRTKFIVKILNRIFAIFGK